MIDNIDKKSLHRLVVVCLENEKIYAHALKDNLFVPLEMGIIKTVKTPQEFENIFSSFTGALDIIVCIMTDYSRNTMTNMLTSNEDVIKQRALVVIPVLIGHSEVQFDFFTTLPIISSTGDMRVLADKVSKAIKNYIHIQWEKLHSFEFENLVKDILKAYHFENIMLCASDHFDFGYDLLCSYHKNDDNGISEENWLVEIKYSREERFTISNIKDTIMQDRSHYMPNSRVMLVTNGTLTSVVVNYVTDLQEKQNLPIYIVDGWKLSNLIALNNNLMNEYFRYE